MVFGALLGRGLIKNIGETQKKPRERNQLEVITWEIHQILGDLKMSKFFLIFFHNTNNFIQPIHIFLMYQKNSRLFLQYQ